MTLMFFKLSDRNVYIKVMDMFLNQTVTFTLDDPCISWELYNLALSLIQSFDELEGKDSRYNNNSP